MTWEDEIVAVIGDQAHQAARDIAAAAPPLTERQLSDLAALLSPACADADRGDTRRGDNAA